MLFRSEAADAKPNIKPEDEVKDEEEQQDIKTENLEHREHNAPLPVPSKSLSESPAKAKKGVKREHEEESEEPRQTSIEQSLEPPTKEAKTEPTGAGGRKTRSATSNDRGVKRVSPRKKDAADGSKKITGFFEKK